MDEDYRVGDLVDFAAPVAAALPASCERWMMMAQFSTSITRWPAKR
jgi:hypothetical protein